MIKPLYLWSISIVFGLFWVIFTSSHALASWPMNTPERQWNPVWAGQNLLWIDDRLGSTDIFMRDEQGVVSPLLTGPGAQTVLAASDSTALISDDQSGTVMLYTLDLHSHAMHALITTRAPMLNAAMWQKQAIWSDGQTVWWWDGTTIRSRASRGASVIGAFGVAIINTDTVEVWQKSSEQSVPCQGCIAIARYNDQLARLDARGSLSLWPSGQAIAAADPTPLLSNGTALLFYTHAAPYVFRDGLIIPFRSVPSGAVFGTIGLVRSDGADITLALEPAPSARALACDLGANAGHCNGAGEGWRVVAEATGSHQNTITRYLDITNGQWDGQVIPPNAGDDTYTILARAESVLGFASVPVPLGQIIIDHTPPKITDATVQTTLDSARIHIQTDEKTTSEISIVANDATDDHIQNRLTFSHTLTVRDLDPDQAYEVRAVVRDRAQNGSSASMHFVTPALSDALYLVSRSTAPGFAGVWEGELVTPPGIIDAKQAVLWLPDGAGNTRPIRIEWTVGIPPPGLKRHRLVRIKGTINSAGTSVLLHRSKSLAVIDATANALEYRVIDASTPALSIDTWVRVYGTLSSVQKTSWKILVGDQEYAIHAESGFPTGFTRRDAVMVQGYVFRTGNSVSVALEQAEHQTYPSVPSDPLSSPVIDQPQASDEPQDVILASIAPAPELLVPEPPAAETSVRLLSSDTYDKDNILWYSIGLYGIAIIISHIFFLGRSQKSGRS